MATFTVLLVGVLFCLTSTTLGQESARLVASKVILNEQIAQGNDLTILYSIFNIGDGPATAVKLEDTSYAEGDFDHVAGLYSATWDRIPAENNVSHVVVVRPKIYGVYNMSYAQLTYFSDSQQTSVVGYTSAPGYTVITSHPEYARKYDSHFLDWIAFVVMVVPTIAIPFMVWHQSQSKYETIKSKKA